MEQAQGTSRAGNTNTCSGKKRRNYFITFWIHEYPKELPKNALYMCTCEDTTRDGKYHGHAFIYFKNPITLKGVKKLFGNDCHVEVPHKNSECIDYVLDTSKRKINFKEFGNRPMDNGIHKMEDVLQCDTVTQVMETMPDTYVKYRKGIVDLIQHKQEKNRYYKPIEVIWIYGKTGKGKTREAFEAGAYDVIYDNGFFSDWGDSRIICFEEFRGEIPYRLLLKLLDGYHNYYRVNIKGGQKLVDVDTVYITSPYHPRECYSKQTDKRDSLDQLMRRITRLENRDIVYANDSDI